MMAAAAEGTRAGCPAAADVDAAIVKIFRISLEQIPGGGLTQTLQTIAAGNVFRQPIKTGDGQESFRLYTTSRTTQESLTEVPAVQLGLPQRDSIARYLDRLVGDYRAATEREMQLLRDDPPPPGCQWAVFLYERSLDSYRDIVLPIFMRRYVSIFFASK
jgi:hypothetical protein